MAYMEPHFILAKAPRGRLGTTNHDLQSELQAWLNGNLNLNLPRPSLFNRTSRESDCLLDPYVSAPPGYFPLLLKEEIHMSSEGRNKESWVELPIVYVSQERPSAFEKN